MTPVESPKPRMISLEEFQKRWDSERKVHELERLQLSIKGTTLYIPAKTKSEFDVTYGGPVTHIKFRTIEDEFAIWLTPCSAQDVDARALVPTTDTQSAAQLGFAIPLRKLGIKVPDTRQYTFDVERLPVDGGGAVYEISFKHFEDVRRQVDAEALAAIKKAKAEKAKAKRAQKRAERLAKVKNPSTGNSGGAAQG